MKFAVIADDLTGAADTGVQLVRAGYSTAVVFRDADVPQEGLDAVALDTDTRTLPARRAAMHAAEAGHAVRDADIVYKKVDSTLRGPIAAELSAVLRATRRRWAVVAPAFPAAGRTTLHGVQLVHGVPVDRTEMRNDPGTPVLEGHLPTLLSEVFPSVGTLSVEDLAEPERVDRELRTSECVVADAGREGDLETLVRSVGNPGEVLWAGSAGLALALGNVYRRPREERRTPPPTPASSVLVVMGSLSGVSRGQLRRLVGEYGDVAVEVRNSSAVAEGATAARAALAGAGCAVIHSPEDRHASGGGGRMLGALAEVAARLAEAEAFDALVLTGGATAVRVARRLGASGIRLLGEIEPGVPTGRLMGARPYRVATKAGGFGGPDTLVVAVRDLIENGEGHTT